MNYVAQPMRITDANTGEGDVDADESPVAAPKLSLNMSPTYITAIVTGLVNDVTNQTPVQELKRFESKNLRFRKVLSENELSMTFSSFLRCVVTDNISYLQEICRIFCPYENCNIDLEFGNGIPTKVMIRKEAESEGLVYSCAITVRTLMSDNCESRSERRLCMIHPDDTLRSHLLCCPSDVEIFIVPSKESLVKFSSSFRSSETKEKDLTNVILMSLDGNDSVCDLNINPDIDEMKEFIKNDKEVISVDAVKSTWSSQSTKRKSGTYSERANKNAKITDTGIAPKTPEKTTIDTDEPQIIETTKKSKVTDPNAPKKPLKVYILYSNANRAKVAEENPTFSFGEIAKEVGKRYREATAEELQPYQAEYDEAVKKYKKELEEYKKNRNGGNDDEQNDEENNKEKNAKSGMNEATGIKKNISAYMHFCIAKGPELKEKGIKPPQSGKVLGKAWQELSDSERAEFEEIAKKDKERYLKAVAD